MCGIAGIVTPGTPPSLEVLERMVTAMHHRGPDGKHTWSEAGVALGMRRLAIVDVEGGAQPLRNERDTVHVMFNGEIYNYHELRAELASRGHRFGSDSDGEVIPHLYEELGPRLFARLDGIFAIAVWDSEAQVMLLARDQFGVKPLYLHERQGELRFASELRALLQDPAVPRELDLVALDRHLTYRFTPSPMTLLAGVQKLEPGTTLRWHHGSSQCEPYRRVGTPERSGLSFAAAAESFRETLRSAVHRQMMSDRPIGVMLSGGVDSAAVTAFMAERSSQVKTFTVGFECGGDADETALARQTASLFGTDHHEMLIGDLAFAEELARTIETLEEPIGTTSALGFRAVSRLASEHVPVLLSGQGADELLGGYWRYIGEWLVGLVHRWPAPVPALASSFAGASTRFRNARLERGLRALRYPDVHDRFLDIYAVFTDSQKSDLYGPDLAMARQQRGTASLAFERFRQEAAGRDSLDQMMYVDLRLWLPDDLLLVGDKMSMAESVEMRVPFLDLTLIDLVESLPSQYKVRHGRRKAIEKAALEGVLPSTIIHRKERGFVTPVDRWLRGELYGYARQLLLDPGSACAQLFNREPIELLLQRHVSGRFDHTRQLFALLSLELWCHRFLSANA